MSPSETLSPVVTDAVILVVDDEELNTRLLARILTRAGFTRVHTTTDSESVARLVGELRPDLIMLDLRMPNLDGLGVLAQLRELVPATEYLPVLAITGDGTTETRQAALSAGARDFLEKPFEASEVVVRARNLLTTRMLHRSLQRHNEMLEEKVLERTAQLQMALRAAESASRAKSQFLATMSHELRTPLNAVIGFSRHLSKNKAGNLRAPDLALLERITANGANLLNIIDDVLDLSRVEAGKLVVDRTSVRLDQLLRGVTEEVVAGSPTSAVAVRALVPAGTLPIDSDEPKLRRVLINLVGNAVKFTQQGFVTAIVKVTDDCRPLRIDVVDSGIGIPAGRQAAIFEMFEQADTGTQRRFGGTGLGLAICRTLCELMDYRLTVVSEEGRGSAFSVLLDPAAVPPVNYAEAASACEDSPLVCA